MGADRTEGYEYITGTESLSDFSTANVSSRDDALIHTVRLTIPTNKLISIEWKAEDEEDFTTLIDEFQCTLDCPEEVMFGFTAGTGSMNANQEIRNVSVSSIPEPHALALLGLFGFGTWVLRRIFMI